MKKAIVCLLLIASFVSAQGLVLLHAQSHHAKDMHVSTDCDMCLSAQMVQTGLTPDVAPVIRSLSTLVTTAPWAVVTCLQKMHAGRAFVRGPPFFHSIIH